MDNLAFREMSVRPLPVAERAEQGNARKSMSQSGFKASVQLRRSTREKQLSKGFEFENYAAKRARALFHSCSSYVCTLTKLEEAIQQLMDLKENLHMKNM